MNVFVYRHCKQTKRCIVKRNIFVLCFIIRRKALQLTKDLVSLFKQLRDRFFVTTGIQKGGYKIFTEACEQQGFTPKVFLECNDYASRTTALLSGVCLGLNLARIDEDAHNPDTQFLAITDFNEELAANVYYKKEKYAGNIKLFLDMLKNSRV